MGKQMEADDGLKTVVCLRGRLLAERMASRVAKEDADHMAKKLQQLENQLKVEIRSRNRMEKRLTFLLKKLDSLNITFVTADSSSEEKIDDNDKSSVSSTASSRTKEPEPKTQTSNLAKREMEEYVQRRNSPIGSEDLEDNASPTCTCNISHSDTTEVSLSSADKANSKDPSEVESSDNCNGPKTDDHSSPTSRASLEKDGSNEGKSDRGQDGTNEGKSDLGQDGYADNSLALVPIEVWKSSQPVEPPMVNASVKEVLDALRHAREQLQWSMERRRHTIQVGSK